MKHENFIYPFNERGKLKKVKSSNLWKLHKKAFEGGLSRSEKNDLYEQIQGCSYSKRGVALLGVMFNFDFVLKRFWVKNAWGISEVWAFDKTCIRRCFPNSKAEIVEVDSD